MNSVERFIQVMNFQPVDHPPIVIDVPWPRTKDRWRQEGWNPDIPLYEFFKIDPLALVNVSPETRLHPPFERRVLEQSERFTIFIDHRGVKCLTATDYEEGIHYLEYPIRGNADRPWLEKRLDPDDAGRWQNGWDQRLAGIDPRTDLGLLDFGSFFGDLHERMGTEAVSLIYYDEPDFVLWYNDRIAACVERAIARILPDPRVKLMGGHEDMAFKNGSFISPAMFREFMTPYYRRTVTAARRRGQTIFWQDSDGNVETLIPLWLEVGVNLITPLEVAAGMDVVRLRAEYGKSLLMLGGIDKRALIAGPEAIRKELLSKKSVIEGGGYIPRLDHTISPDISWPNYQYYINLLKGMYGF
jgi:uroporphyrinogen decarboxylase